MEETIARIRQAAVHHSQTAQRLWQEAKQLRESRPEARWDPQISARIRELNARAIDASHKAINGFDFVKRITSASTESH